MIKQQVDQHIPIARLLLEAYPQGLCSQGLARDIALQLPRVVNDFRYKPNWKLEDYHELWGINLKSVRCKHNGTRNARDYILSFIGFDRLKKIYSSPVVKQTVIPKNDYSNYVFIGNKAYKKEDLEPRQGEFFI